MMPLKHEKAKVAAEKEQRRRARQMFDATTGLWEWIVTRRHPKEVKHWGIDQPPNPAVLAALNKLIDQTWLLTPPTKVRYMITLDMRHHMFKGRHFCKTYVVPKKGKKATATTTKPPTSGGGDAETEKKSKKHLYAECFYNKHVTPGHAAIILALQILKREKNVKLAVFTEEGIQIVSIERNFSNIEEAEFVLRVNLYVTKYASDFKLGIYRAQYARLYGRPRSGVFRVPYFCGWTGVKHLHSVYRDTDTDALAEMESKRVHLPTLNKCHHHQLINVPIAGAQAFPMDGIGR
ncbi:hypothetical protein evm_014396 [Chilo suppressalis]|nr:hypothetical protein evm_014396 [Chilo suppressalis]